MSKHKGNKCRIVFFLRSSRFFSADTLARYAVKRYRLSVLHNIYTADHNAAFSCEAPQRRRHTQTIGHKRNIV